MSKKGLWLGLLVLLLLWPASAALADDPSLQFDDGRIYVEEDVSLEQGQVFDGDLGVFDGDLYIPQGSTVNGDVFVADGDAEIAGRINGSIALFGGELHVTESGVVKGDAFVLGGELWVAGQVAGDVSGMFGHIELLDSAEVQGDLVVLSGSLERSPDARVLGEEMPEIPLPRLPMMPEMPDMPDIPDMPRMPKVPDIPDIPNPSRVVRHVTPAQQFGRFVGRVVGIGFSSLFFIGLGVLIVFAWPRHTRRVSECIAAMPVQSFALGLLTFLIAAVIEAMAMVLLIILVLVAAALISTVILIPIGLLLLLLSVLVLLPVPLILAAGMIMGWVGLAELIGRRVIKVLKAGYVQPLGATLVGLMITVAVAALLWLITPACCGWPFIILLTSVGLGAVFHTRFGRQSCNQAAPASGQELLPAEAMDEELGVPDGPADQTP